MKAFTAPSFLRRVAAILVVLSGTCQIAALWLRELDGLAIADALTGSLYLLIGIGLFGQSRLSLALAILVPAASIAVIYYMAPEPARMYQLHSAVDALVISLCVVELWRVRHNRSP